MQLDFQLCIFLAASERDDLPHESVYLNFLLSYKAETIFRCLYRTLPITISIDVIFWHLLDSNGLTSLTR